MPRHKLRSWLVFSFVSACVSLPLAAAEPAVPPLDLQKVARAAEPTTAFKEIVRVSRPSVVSISALKRASRKPSAERRLPQLPDKLSPPDALNEDLLKRFFEFRLPQEEPDRRGQGSGVIVREDGYLLTNHHLVGDADQVTVTLADKRQLRAEVGLGRNFRAPICHSLGSKSCTQLA